MTVVKKNILNLEVGDVITFTNDKGYRKSLMIRRIEEKSCYLSRFLDEETHKFVFRESWNTVANYQKYRDFTIIKK